VRPLIIALVAFATTAHADPTSGVDSALFRGSYDANGVFAVEGARLMPKHDLSFKFLVGYERSPLNVAIPGIGGLSDTGKDKVLDYLTTIDMAFGMSISDAVAIGIDVAAYRTATGSGYGVRGLYTDPTKKSTGLISLRPLSNIDPSADPNDSTAYLGDGLAGPLDARFGLKYALFANHRVALTAVGSVFLPFGNDEMLLGDRNLVFEPKLAFEFRPDRIHATRVVANVAARIRERAVLEAYDPADPMSMPKAFLDIGSEAVVGLGAVVELAPRAFVAAEAQVFVPLPDALDWGSCRLNDGEPCSQATYFGDAKHGDLTTLATAGLMFRVSADVTASVMAGTGQLGARSDTFSVTTGITWSPQPGGSTTHFGDRDGDGIPDNVDQCPDEPEDFDGFQDADGCPDPDNDGDGIPDVSDKCPNEPETKNGYQDADGCPDEIPESDGIPDKLDKCPNDPETFNGFEDEDGCPDSRPGNGPEERPDRIDLKGAQVAFTRGGAALTPQAKSLLNQVAAIIKTRKLTVRVEVHVALGVKSTNAAVITAQKRRDKVLGQQRAQAIQQYLVSQGVPIAQVQAVGIGSDRPLGASNPSDPVNERVDLIKSQQGTTP